MRKYAVCLAVFLGVLFLTSLSMAQRVEGAGGDGTADIGLLPTDGDDEDEAGSLDTVPGVQMVPDSQESFEAMPTHAAFAYGPVNQIATYAGGSDPVSAQRAAESACRDQGGGADCQGVGWWTNGWASFALNTVTNNWGWCTDPDLTIADRCALDFCGSNCRLIYRVGIGGSAPYEWGNLRPVDGESTVEGYAPGEGDHTGRDLYAVDFFSDQPAVYPVRPGEVVFSGWNCQTVSGNPPCYGNTVAVDHGGGIYSIYTHLAANGLAANGQRVTPHAQIGTMSNSGCPVSICGSRPHLHFAVRSGPLSLGADALFESNTPIRTPWTP